MRKLIILCVYALLLNCFAQGQSNSSASPVKFDEFGGVNCENELAHLDAFNNHLQSNPDLHGYLIVYGGRTGAQYEALALAARMRFYLTRTRGLDGRRLTTIDGGHRETLGTEIWLGRRGEPMPASTPTLQTKDLSLKGRARVLGYDCGARLGL